MHNPVRLELYDKIREYVKALVIQRLTEDPHLLDDEKTQREIPRSLKSLQGIFDILDQYDIVRRPK